MKTKMSSALKRHLLSQKRRLINRSKRHALNTQLKKIHANISEQSVRLGQKLLAVAAQQKIIHWKVAAKKTSKLMRLYLNI